MPSIIRLGTIILLVAGITGVSEALDLDDVRPWQITGLYSSTIRSNGIQFTVTDNNTLNAVSSSSTTEAQPTFPPTSVKCIHNSTVSQCDSISSGNWTFDILPGTDPVEGPKYPYENFILRLQLTERLKYKDSDYWKTFVAEQEFGGINGIKFSVHCAASGFCTASQTRSHTPTLLTQKLTDCKGDC
jgi:hypothetical protein